MSDNKTTSIPNIKNISPSVCQRCRVAVLYLGRANSRAAIYEIVYHTSLEEMNSQLLDKYEIFVVSVHSYWAYFQRFFKNILYDHRSFSDIKFKWQR